MFQRTITDPTSGRPKPGITHPRWDIMFLPPPNTTTIETPGGGNCWPCCRPSTTFLQEHVVKWNTVFNKPWSAKKAANPSAGRVINYGLRWKPCPPKPSKHLTETTVVATFRSSLFRTVSARTMAWQSGTRMVSGSFLVNDAKRTLAELKISPFTKFFIRWSIYDSDFNFYDNRFFIPHRTYILWR